MVKGPRSGPHKLLLLRSVAMLSRQLTRPKASRGRDPLPEPGSGFGRDSWGRSAAAWSGDCWAGRRLLSLMPPALSADPPHMNMNGNHSFPGDIGAIH